jgi:hypothetical protein
MNELIFLELVLINDLIINELILLELIRINELIFLELVRINELIFLELALIRIHFFVQVRAEDDNCQCRFFPSLPTRQVAQGLAKRSKPPTLVNT